MKRSDPKTKKKDTVRLNFEFPRKEYPYLKLLCAKKGLSLRDFATDMLVRAIKDYEDEQLEKLSHARLLDRRAEDLISWDEARRIAGWTDDEIQD